MDKKLEMKASKSMSYILRHNPGEFGLTLDEEGYVNIKDLLYALTSQFKYREIILDDIKYIVQNDNKGRYEIKGDLIRAIYGHSTKDKIVKKPCEPPKVLYHGTTPDAYRDIKREGLKSMNRQYVHLSQDIETAIMVAKRRTNTPELLTIDTSKAYKAGIKFYKEANGIYLSDNIPKEYIIF